MEKEGVIYFCPKDVKEPKGKGEEED